MKTSLSRDTITVKVRRVEKGSNSLNPSLERQPLGSTMGELGKEIAKMNQTSKTQSRSTMKIGKLLQTARHLSQAIYK